MIHTGSRTFGCCRFGTACSAGFGSEVSSPLASRGGALSSTSMPTVSCESRPEYQEPVRVAVYIGGLLGLTLLMAMALRTDLPAMLQTLQSAGWRGLWIIPYPALFFFLHR